MTVESNNTLLYLQALEAFFWVKLFRAIAKVVQRVQGVIAPNSYDPYLSGHALVFINWRLSPPPLSQRTIMFFTTLHWFHNLVTIIMLSSALNYPRVPPMFIVPFLLSCFWIGTPLHLLNFCLYPLLAVSTRWFIPVWMSWLPWKFDFLTDQYSI